MFNNARVGVVILNYCTWKDTLKCVKSIRKNEEGNGVYICVVDNHSPVSADPLLLGELDCLCNKIIFNKENKGYNAGNNVGLAHLMSVGLDYYMIINSDVVVPEGTIEQLIKVAEKDKRIGIVGPNVVEHGKVVFYGCNRKKTLASIYLTNTVLSRLFKRYSEKLYNYEKYSASQDDHYIVYSVSGSCFMLTDNCLKSIYPLDDTRKLYNEENILGHRMAKNGFITAVSKAAFIYHEHGVSTNRNKAASFIEKVKSDYYYIKRYLRKNDFLIFPLLLLRKVAFAMKYRKKEFNPDSLKFPSLKELRDF